MSAPARARARLLALAACLCCGAAPPARAADPRLAESRAAEPRAAEPDATEAAPAAQQAWSFRVDARALASGKLTVALTLRGFSGPLRICADMPGGGRTVSDVRALAAGDAADAPGKKVRRDPEDDDCFLATAPARGPLRLRYTDDLAALAGGRGDPDLASRSGDDYIFNEEAVLLRPDPLPEGAPIDVEFLLPEGVSVAAVWQRDAAAAGRFHTDSDEYESGSYVALGHLHPLAPVEATGGAFDLVALGGAYRASDAALREWVGRAGRAVATFYRGVPTGRVLVLLAASRGDGGGVFGSVLNRGKPSVVLYFGRDSEDAAFLHDWIPWHELFHTGNPRLERRAPWVSEGSATYYQDVLRARTPIEGGGESPAAMMGDLHEGFALHCNPAGASLAEESAALRERRHYGAVYWGAACLFFRADVAIRAHSKNARSLDDVLRELYARGRREPLSEDEVIEALDGATGAPVVRAGMESERPVALPELYRRLGVEPISEDKVRLRDDAPDAAIRRGILGER